MVRAGLSRNRRAEIEKSLGYNFVDPGLLLEALTHSSVTRIDRGKQAGWRSNERLEFLGDRVVGLIVANLLIEAFPDEPEGALSRRHDSLIRRETLADIARDLGMGQWLTLGRSEMESGGRANPAILADGCEALIGALYLDGGFDVVRAFVIKHWSPRIGEMGKPPRDPKTELQEWAQAQGLALPDYRMIARSGPAHSPTFQIEVSIENKGHQTATGPSKRVAEQEAARLLLNQLAEALVA